MNKFQILTILVGVLGAILSFTLPFLFPTHDVCVSMSYDVGFNNKIGILILALTALIIFLLGATRNNNNLIHLIDYTPDSCISKKLFKLVVLVNVTVFLLFALTCSSYLLAGGEASYFVSHIYDVVYGRTPYIDFVYYYGPIFVYFPYLLFKILPFVSVETSYILSLAISQVLCLYGLKYVVNRFTISRDDKNFIFSVLAISLFPITLGYNGSMLRCLPSIYFVMKYMEIQEKCTSIVINLFFTLFSSVVCLCISPEIGLVYTFILSAYSLFEVLTEKKILKGLNVLVIVSLYVIVYLFLPGILKVIFDFSTGCNNFPFIPFLGLVLYIIMIMVLSFYSGQYVCHIRDYKKEIIIILTSFSLIPAALGRADAHHLILNGWLIALIYFAIEKKYYNVVSKYSRIIVCIFAFWITPYLLINYGYIYLSETKATICEHTGIMESSLLNQKKQLPFEFKQGDKVAYPFATNNFYYVTLVRDGLYAPQFDTRVWFSATLPNMIKCVDDIKKSNPKYVLLPDKWEEYIQPTMKFDKLLFLFPKYVYPKRNGNVAYEPLIDYLKNNYSKIDANDNWLLYQINQ